MSSTSRPRTLDLSNGWPHHENERAAEIILKSGATMLGVAQRLTRFLWGEEIKFPDDHMYVVLRLNDGGDRYQLGPIPEGTPDAERYHTGSLGRLIHVSEIAQARTWILSRHTLHRLNCSPWQPVQPNTWQPKPPTELTLYNRFSRKLLRPLAQEIVRGLPVQLAPKPDGPRARGAHLAVRYTFISAPAPVPVHVVSEWDWCLALVDDKLMLSTGPGLHIVTVLISDPDCTQIMRTKLKSIIAEALRGAVRQVSNNIDKNLAQIGADTNFKEQLLDRLSDLRKIQ